MQGSALYTPLGTDGCRLERFLAAVDSGSPSQNEREQETNRQYLGAPRHRIKNHQRKRSLGRHEGWRHHRTSRVLQRHSQESAKKSIISPEYRALESKQGIPGAPRLLAEARTNCFCCLPSTWWVHLWTYSSLDFSSLKTRMKALAWAPKCC